MKGVEAELETTAAAGNRRASSAPGKLANPSEAIAPQPAATFILVEPAIMTARQFRAIVVGGTQSADQARRVLEATRTRIKAGLAEIPEDRSYDARYEWQAGPTAQCQGGRFYGVLILWAQRPPVQDPDGVYRQHHPQMSRMHATCGHSSEEGVRRHLSRICGENSWGVNRIAPWQPADDIGCPQGSWVAGEIKAGLECRYVIGKGLDPSTGADGYDQSLLSERAISCAAQ